MHRFMMLLVAVAWLAGGCREKRASSPTGAVGPQTVLAKVDDMVITAADLKELLARHGSQPFVLARYSSIEKKKELLDSLIRFQVLAIEARKRGYERDPEVQRVAKDKMVRLFTQQEVNDKVKLSDLQDAEIQKFYQEHAADYVRPESVRVSQILVKERGQAARVLAAAQALPKADMKAFRDLVAKESEDPDSKQRGGDLTQFDRASTQHPREVVAAAFALKAAGDLSELVSTDRGFAILKLTERRPAVSRSFEEARLDVQKRLLEELRATRRKELADEMRETVPVEVFEDELAKLDLGALAPTPVGLDAGPVVGNRP
jgi:peptidyl-prolyl cis-trans isomerase C